MTGQVKPSSRRGTLNGVPITKNAVSCKQCGTYLESKLRFRTMQCECGAINIRGGLMEFGRGGELNLIREHSSPIPVKIYEDLRAAKLKGEPEMVKIERTVKKRARRLTTSDKANIYRLKRGGMNATGIAQELSMPYPNVSRVLREKFGLTRKGRKAKPVKSAPVVVAVAVKSSKSLPGIKGVITSLKQGRSLFRKDSAEFVKGWDAFADQLLQNI